jgi:hypothetical protein
LSLVENGSTLSDLVELISSKISSDLAAKLLNVVIGTLGVVPKSVKSTQIDLEATLKSVVNISAANIPRPNKNAGIISMSWIANLDHCKDDQLDFRELLKKF